MSLSPFAFAREACPHAITTPRQLMHRDAMCLSMQELAKANPVAFDENAAEVAEAEYRWELGHGTNCACTQAAEVRHKIRLHRIAAVQQPIQRTQTWALPIQAVLLLAHAGPLRRRRM